jgi:hypothetical protein
VTFTDIDLPPGSSLIIQDEHDYVIPQPELLASGVWRRPVFQLKRRHGHLYITLIPPTECYPGEYAGFRAVASVDGLSTPLPITGLPSSQNRSSFCIRTLSEACPALVSAAEGRTLTLRSSPLGIFTDKLYDCVWQLKAPSQMSAAVYIRILGMHITGKSKRHVHNIRSIDLSRFFGYP